jgi:thymidylate kinase
MARTVLITVSGMVGSGKSSGESRMLRMLRDARVPVEAWRFRTLPCFSFPFGSSAASNTPANNPVRTVRGRGYRRKRLTLSATAVYLWRMAAFRVYRQWRHPDGWTICNRYFYDNLAHYDLEAPEAGRYLAVLRRFMPRPDLAIVFVASPAVIADRRPQYSAEYLDQVGQSYSSLIARFPELVVVNSDPGGKGYADVDRLITERLAASTRRSTSTPATGP